MKFRLLFMITMTPTEFQAVNSLKDDAIQLIKLGQDWGLTSKEIENCITNALHVSTLNEKKKFPKITRKSIKYRQDLERHRLKGWIPWLIFCGILIIPGIGLVSMGSEVGLDVVEIVLQIPPKSVMDGHYYVMRYYRQFVTALTTKFNVHLEGYYDAQCIVYNPLWKDIDQAECDICESLNHVREFKNKGEVLDLDLYESPLIHKNLLPRVVSLEDVTAVVQRSKVKLSTPVKSSASWSRTAREFADNATVDKIKNSHEFYFHWTSLKNILVGQIMRTIFPRPHIFSKELEVSLDKYLYVDGPNTKGYQLENFIEPGYDWYSQGFGVRTLQFSPCNKTCATQCPAFHITVSQRDVLTYVRGIWDVSVLDNGEDLSISYMGHLVSF